MCSRALLGTAVALLVLAGIESAAESPQDDTAAVRRHVVQQADAWNRHDAAAYSALFTSNCDVVNVVGWWWKSRAEMQQQLTRAFGTVFSRSTLRFGEVDVRFLTPAIAVAHARWTMQGAQMPPGMPPPDAGIQTLVLTKDGGGWSIAVFQNTIAKPERPFPEAPAPTP